MAVERQETKTKWTFRPMEPGEQPTYADEPTRELDGTERYYKQTNPRHTRYRLRRLLARQAWEEEQESNLIEAS